MTLGNVIATRIPEPMTSISTSRLPLNGCRSEEHASSSKMKARNIPATITEGLLASIIVFMALSIKALAGNALSLEANE
jgi:hypothetical protein